MINGEIESNSDEITEKAFDINSIPRSQKAGRKIAGNEIKVNLTMNQVVAQGWTDRRDRYAYNTLNFEQACMGERSTYSLDSAVKGGTRIRTLDGKTFTVGKKGMDALRPFLNLSKMPEGD